MLKILRYINTNTFFIKNIKEGLLIDTDWAGTLPMFYKEIKNKGILLSDIKYVLATHYHPDHMGLVSELMDLGITLIIMDVQRDYIHYSDEFFKHNKSCNYNPINETKAIYIECEQSRKFLNNLGIKGEIIHTPGHSNDSISLILDEGIAIVGDLPPIDFVDAYENNQLLKESWKLILQYKPKNIYYSHANEKTINQ